MDELIALKQEGTITPNQQATLTTLRAETEALTVRKAHAFALLKGRGVSLPTRDQLPLPTV